MVKRPSDKTLSLSPVDSSSSFSFRRGSILILVLLRLVLISLIGTAMVLRILLRNLQTSLSNMISGFVVCSKLSYGMVTCILRPSPVITSSRKIVLVVPVLLHGPSVVVALRSSSISPFRSSTSTRLIYSLTTTSRKSTPSQSTRTLHLSPSSTHTFLRLHLQTTRPSTFLPS